MAGIIHVNGEAKIRTGTAAAAALEDLGVSVDGVSIEVRDFTDDVITDTFGPHVPFDEQQFLMDAIVRCQLVWYDDVVLSKVRSRPGYVNSATEGILGNAGTLWGAGGYYFRLLVLSPVDSIPWNFPKARQLSAWPHKIGTRRTLWDLTFRAVPYTGVVGLTAGTVLYNRITT